MCFRSNFFYLRTDFSKIWRLNVDLEEKSISFVFFFSDLGFTFWIIRHFINFIGFTHDSKEEKSMTIHDKIKNMSPQETQCGTTNFASVCFTSIFPFFLHNFCNKKFTNFFFSKIRHILPPNRSFFVVLFHRKQVSFKTYRKLRRSFPHLRLLLFFSTSSWLVC